MLCSLAFIVLQSLANTKAELLFTRFFLGAFIGILLAIVPVYIVEVCLFQRIILSV
jgi:hypothetical protein